MARLSFFLANQSITKAIVLTGIVLLLLCGVLLLRQHTAISNQFNKAMKVSEREDYIFPENYKHYISHYYTYYIDSLNHPNFLEAISLNKKGEFVTWHEQGMPLNLGRDNSNLWFYLPVKNESAHDICFVWQIFNTIDTAQLFCKTESNVYTHPLISFSTPLYQRSIKLRAIFDTVWLNAYQQKELYLYVSKNNYNTYMPMVFKPLPELLQEEGFISNIYCVYIAVFGFIILFNLFLFISLRDPIHLWYSFFIFSISMGMLIGDYYQIFLFPDPLQKLFCKTLNTPFADFSILGTGRVMQLLLQQNRISSRFWLPVTIFLNANLFFGVFQLLVGAIYLKSGLHYPYPGFRAVSDILLWCTTPLLICSVIEKVLQKQPLARIYFITSMLPTIGLLNYYLNGIGVTNFLLLYPNGFAVGVMLEVLVLTMLLTQRYNLLQHEKNQLLNQQLALQKEMSDRVAETLESEQKRIAADLHDGLGSYLAALRLMVNKSMHHFRNKGETEPAQTLETVQQHIDKAVGDIRTISHNLMPSDFEQYAFHEIVKNHLTTIITTTQLNIEYYVDDQVNALAKSTQLTLYRIFTEVMNNALKHSGGRNITVQFISHDAGILQMLVEDDGKGYKIGVGDSGLGLKNIRSRVDFLKGKLNIDSSEKGTILIVEIPMEE